MKNCTLIVFFAFVLCLISYSQAEAINNEDAVDAAYRVCYAMEKTGLTTGCKVGGWKEVVDVRIDMSSSEARKTCASVAEMMSGITTGFRGKDWKMRIFSPYSGDQPIAICDLY